MANQALFEKLLVGEGGRIKGAILAEPWATLLREEFIEEMRQNTENPTRVFSGSGLKEDLLVPPTGHAADGHRRDLRRCKAS